MRRTKEALVIDMLNKGLTAMEIAKQAHVSFTEIKKARNKLTGEVNEEPKRKNPLSIPSKAFKLFLKGRSIVEVAISLDLPTDQVLKIHCDYLILQNMDKTSLKLTGNKKNLGAYLKLFDFLDGNNIKMNDLNNAVGLVRKLDNLRKERAQLEFDIDTLIETKK